MKFSSVALIALSFLATAVPFSLAATPPPGRFVDLGGWRLYIDCEGHGSPTVVVETGFDEYARDWVLVQQQVRRTTRICLYDRAGYGFSDAGPKPRTFDQENFELHRLLELAGEHGPLVLVGHSYGGPLIRRYAGTYPKDVAGMVLAEATPEGSRVNVGSGKFVRLVDFANDKAPPPPRTTLDVSIQKTVPPVDGADPSRLDPELRVLPPREQRWHAWADARPDLQEAMQSEREWSPNYLRDMTRTPQEGSLGDMPLIVLTRADGGYQRVAPPLGPDLERERVQQQAALAKLSKRGRQRIVKGDHDLQLTNPVAVATAIVDVVKEVRSRRSAAAR